MIVIDHTTHQVTAVSSGPAIAAIAATQQGQTSTASGVPGPPRG